ncbi:hypothetical protein E2C01_079852 [Portunus trituberculatus]|uniref:Uncharacterized protein n=1 Tax=Portunus trituberculatus TaxID=210409 RepID=A0A5B7IRW7_PORTR|nr:hypothetical protein [Portunus trituberculatus]
MISGRTPTYLRGPPCDRDGDRDLAAQQFLLLERVVILFISNPGQSTPLTFLVHAPPPHPQPATLMTLNEYASATYY